MKKILSHSFLVVAFAVLMPQARLVAQCATCKANVESNLQQPGNHVGKGLNRGILYLMAMPFVFAGIVGGLWYYQRRQSTL